MHEQRPKRTPTCRAHWRKDMNPNNLAWKAIGFVLDVALLRFSVTDVVFIAIISRTYTANCATWFEFAFWRARVKERHINCQTRAHHALGPI